MDAIELSLFSSRLDAICAEMGAVLQRAAFSPNIKDRLDYSCAIFSADGKLAAQAAHIPVHLGSMAYAMADIVSQVDWQDGDVLILNDPYLGGTHLPDVTVVAPLFFDGKLLAFVVNRAHHADIGAHSPGSMPLSHTLDQEGVIIPPSKIYRCGQLDEVLMAALMANMANQQQSRGDFAAQFSSLRTASQRLMDLIKRMGVDQFTPGLLALNDYAARLAASSLREIPDGCYEFSDVMDSDGQGNTALRIACMLEVNQGQVRVDFQGTTGQVAGNINCPLSVAAAAVYYVFRCLMPANTPNCHGSFSAIEITAPPGCLLNAQRPAAVAAGNVETSMRITDVILGALAQAIPERVCAAGQGSMNNVAMGARSAQGSWDYYETLGGGMGAHVNGNGASALQVHMTNTLNTPIESLEMHYPLRIRRYAIRRGSGGAGRYRGGDGLVREYEFLEDAQLSLLTERRHSAPWGLEGGEPGLCGENRLGSEPLADKCSLMVRRGQVLTISTPGGGGWGRKD